MPKSISNFFALSYFTPASYLRANVMPPDDGAVLPTCCSELTFGLPRVIGFAASAVGTETLYIVACGMGFGYI